MQNELSWSPGPPKVSVAVVDVSTSSKDVKTCGDFKFVSRNDVLSCSAADGEKSSTLLPDDRGKATVVMNKALEAFLSKVQSDDILAGVIGLGGSGGTSLISSGFPSFPIGIPKLIVSIEASGNTEPYVGTSDLVLFPSVVDVCGINNMSRSVLSNVVAAFAGMVMGQLKLSEESATDNEKPTSGGRAMEDLVKAGLIQGVLDITTTEVADYTVGGNMACDSSRFDAILDKKIPLVLRVGALDMVNLGPRATVPSNFQQRNIYEHNEQVTLMQTTIYENVKFAAFKAKKLNKSSSKVRVYLPKMGVFALDEPDKAFYDPEATGALIHEMQRKMVDSTVVAVDLPSKPPSTTEFGSTRSIPPINTAIFSQQQPIDSNYNLGGEIGLRRRQTCGAGIREWRRRRTSNQ
ncbi:toMV susceptible protein tm-1(GCR26)-like [Primulina eburnea]|uniref:toMV susceptible protein tm-1(GCR26)-like n=2 Tax=Primulina eburnea TaxID=1245227 RepID=UPI003C6BF56A